LHRQCLDFDRLLVYHLCIIMFVCFPVHFLLVILYDLCAAFGIISDEFLWTILCRRLHVINILGRLIFTDIVRMYSAGAVLGNFFFLGGGLAP